MAWLTSLPAPVIVANERYVERRTKPGDEEKEQYRRRALVTIEYRGLDYTFATLELVGYPEIDGEEIATRSISPIGGGGYTLTQIQDYPTSNWIDFSENEQDDGGSSQI